MMRVKEEDEFYDSKLADRQVKNSPVRVNEEEESLNAVPCSVYFGPCAPFAFQGRGTGPGRQSTKGRWSEVEDYLLNKSVAKFQGRNWKKIAESVPKRTVSQCFTRWNRVLSPGIVKGTWTQEEDEEIVKSVRKYGPKNWSLIAKSLPGRLGKQCRERC